MKAAFVGIVGRPSSGKSTLLNQMCGNKVSIVSPVPQTTRNSVRGIYNGDQGQLVFVDTPGFHLSDKKFNLHLRNLVLKTVAEADLVLYLVDVSRAPGDEERALRERLAEHRPKLVAGLNKVDFQPNYLQSIQAEIRSWWEAPRLYPLSALNGEGVPALLEELFRLAPEGERLYPEEYYTDQSPEFRIKEIIREKAILQTYGEVPHALFVGLEDLEMKGEDLLWVRGFLYVERESQKGILVGRNGDRIRGIVLAAQEELDRIFPYRVQLDIRVKVKPKWRSDSKLLEKLIS